MWDTYRHIIWVWFVGRFFIRIDFMWLTYLTSFRNQIDASENTIQRISTRKKEFFNLIWKGNICKVIQRVRGDLRVFKKCRKSTLLIMFIIITDGSHMISAKMGRQEVLSHSDFFCIFSQNLGFPSQDQGEGGKLFYF